MSAVRDVSWANSYIPSIAHMHMPMKRAYIAKYTSEDMRQELAEQQV